MELLEAKSDDGLITWNFFDAAIETAMKSPPGQRILPVFRVTRQVAFPTRIIQ